MGNTIIKNPKEDMYGNSKENILLAFDGDENYLGSGYIYPKLNFDMSPEHPLNIYVDITMATASEIGNDVSCELLSRLMDRAKEVKEEYKEIQGRLYFGSLGDDQTKYDFFLSQGFIHDEGSYLLERATDDYVVDSTIQNDVDVKVNDLFNEIEKEIIIKVHNDIFIKQMDDVFMKEVSEYELSRNFTAYHKNEIIGNIMIYAEKSEDGRTLGKIESLFVLNEWRNKKIARQLMDLAMGYFKLNGIDHVRLVVWSANKVAHSFYERLGFRFIKETELYLGICLENK